MMNGFPIVLYCYIYEIQIMQYFSLKAGVTSLLESQKIKIVGLKKLIRSNMNYVYIWYST